MTHLQTIDRNTRLASAEKLASAARKSIPSDLFLEGELNTCGNGIKGMISVLSKKGLQGKKLFDELLNLLERQGTSAQPAIFLLQAISLLRKSDMLYESIGEKPTRFAQTEPMDVLEELRLAQTESAQQNSIKPGGKP